MTPDDPQFNQNLGAWLRARLTGVHTVEICQVVPPKSGYSAETMVIETLIDGVEQRFVLRRETADPPVYPVQNPAIEIEIDVQYRSMAAIAAATTQVPLASLIGFEADPAVLGAPFFVMAHVAGEVPIESPIYTAEGFFVDATPAQRRAMIDDGLRVLAALHAADWRAAGFEWLDAGPEPAGLGRQLRLWEEYTIRELAGREHPVVTDALVWLHANRPSDGSISLSWGDPRPGNIIWRDFRAVCATDFEAVSLAPPEHDLGWWLLFDRWSHEAMGVARLEGEPTRDEQREMYQRHAGRPVGDTHWHEVFAAVRYSAIVVRVMNRMVDRGQMPAEAVYWRDNHAVACLAELMAERQ